MPEWNHQLEDIIGLVFLLGVIAAYSLKFAVTRTRRLAWLSVAMLAIMAMAVLIGLSPRASAPASSAHDDTAGEARR